MRFYTLMIALLVPLPNVWAQPAVQDSHSVATRLADPRPMVVSHRACWKSAAENSLAGIADCIALGVDMIEIDLRETKDGVVVLLHDRTLDRTTGLSGALRDKRYSEIKATRLRAGLGGANAPFIDAQVPTFEEVLEATRGRILVFLDIKEPIHEHVLRLIEKHGARDSVLFSMNRNFGPGLRHAGFVGKAALMPKLSQYRDGQCARGQDPAPDIADYAALNAPIYEAVFCEDSFLDRVHMQTQDAGIWVNALGPDYAAGRDEAQAATDPGAVWGSLLQHGVTAIQTDHPAELMAYLRKIGKR